MRVSNWHSREVFDGIWEWAEDNANIAMDKVVAAARLACPIDPTVRPPGWSSGFVSFVPKKGRNKGERVEFFTTKRWKGRSPGNLRDTIRRVNKKGSGTVRVIAGNFKIYWAFMVEKSGYHDRGGKFHPPKPFLRRPFNAMKRDLLKTIKDGR